MHFTPSRSKVSPRPNPSPAPTLPESHCAMPPNPVPPCPPQLPPPLGARDTPGPRTLYPASHGHPPLRRLGRLPPLHCPALLRLSCRHSNFLLDRPDAGGLALPLLLSGERCLILRLQIMNTVYVCALKTFYLIAPFFLSLLAASPSPAFSSGFWGAMLSIGVFFSLTLLF